MLRLLAYGFWLYAFSPIQTGESLVEFMVEYRKLRTAGMIMLFEQT